MWEAKILVGGPQVIHSLNPGEKPVSILLQAIHTSNEKSISRRISPSVPFAKRPVLILLSSGTTPIRINWFPGGTFSSSKLTAFFSILLSYNPKGFFGFPRHILVGRAFCAVRQYFDYPVAGHIEIEFGVLIGG